MSINGYLLDTNIAIALIADEPAALHFVNQAVNDRVACYFSVITESEVLTGIEATHMDRSNRLLKPARCIHVTSAIAREAADLRKVERVRIGRKLKTPDALIIATALKHQYALVSRDSDMNFVQAEYGLTHIVI